MDILEFIDARFSGSTAFTEAFPGGIEYERGREGIARPHLLAEIVVESKGESTEESAYSESVMVQFTIVTDSLPEGRTLRTLLCRDPDAGFDRIARASLAGTDLCLTAHRTGGTTHLDPDPGPDAGALYLTTIDYLFVLSRED